MRFTQCSKKLFLFTCAVWTFIACIMRDNKILIMMIMMMMTTTTTLQLLYRVYNFVRRPTGGSSGHSLEQVELVRK